MKKEARHSHAGMIVTIFILAMALIICAIVLLSRASVSDANTALIHIDGVIYSGSNNGILDGNTYSDDVSDWINQAVQSKNIKVILFEINSPGGSAVGSSEIADAIYKAKASGKQTVALIREQGTSGAYWIASACNHIIVHPLAITGSIGVLASYLEYGGLLERYNVTYERLNAGIYKDTMSPYRDLTDDERTILQSKVNLIYDAFVKEVAKNRNLSEEKVKTLATGMFYIGSEAKELGLVDQLGDKDDAVAYVKTILKTSVKIKDYQQSNNLLYKMYGLQSQLAFLIGKGIGSNLVQSGVEIKA